jgi:hypothetical protein
MNKIEALRATIVSIENGMNYNWYSSNSCNCGVIAKTLCDTNDLNSIGFKESPLLDPKRSSVFSSKAYCLTSNLPLPLMFKKLKESGFTHQDLLELEWLGNEKILKRIGEPYSFWKEENCFIIDNQKYLQKDILTKYLKAWVDILEEESNVVAEVKVVEAIKDIPKHITREKTVYVSVPETITTLAEIILS